MGCLKSLVYILLISSTTSGFGIKCRSNMEQYLGNQFEIKQSHSEATDGYFDEMDKDYTLGWRNPGPVPKNLKVAIFGDIGMKKRSYKVLNMVQEWGAQGVIITGDLDYKNRPKRFMKMIEETLNDDVPVFAAIGNHDIISWNAKNGYQALFVKRLKAQKLHKLCVGEYGINMICGWNGLSIVTSGVGTMGSGFVDFIEDTFSLSRSNWKLCSWHKCQRNYQIGDKSNETGYTIYDICRRYGGIVLTSHTHTYSRTKLVDHYKKMKYSNDTENMTLHVGKSFNIVSGLGGHSIDSSNKRLKSNPWWASGVSKEDGKVAGATLCTFHVDNDPKKARCVFKDIDGKIWDEWEFYSEIINEKRPPRLIRNKKASKDTMFSGLDKSKNRQTKMNGNNDLDDLDGVSDTEIELVLDEKKSSDEVYSEPKFQSDIKDNNNSQPFGKQSQFYEFDEDGYGEFPINRDSDIAIGTLESGFLSDCKVSDFILVGAQGGEVLHETLIAALQFTNLNLERSETISAANVQMLVNRKNMVETETREDLSEKINPSFSERLFMWFSKKLGVVERYQTEEDADKSQSNTILELRVVHNKNSVKLCQKNDVNFKALLKVEPVTWEIPTDFHDALLISPDISKQINYITSSKRWRRGDTIDIFITPQITIYETDNKDKNFISVFGHGISDGCWAPTLAINK
ncbi:hypothetical protein AX774_g5666 [Zancudomyces culisetae]|uniref:Calcineurin-like phosphoesterase domain-containing protein n=1 Tax=Zancudomyces culisetae TaxID=1213189 RepID=A0A1R1PIT3_ZANCU|nr:hypothetical protein AX774_g5666 [Zancudomyces culisetae]|eukprot:OMH80891.1 hypothetical protein AX774_g5666 [Zancudomyces culisetae]